MKKAISTLLLLAAVAFFGAGPAKATDYPAPAPGGVSDASVAPGTSVAFSGSGFDPGEAITVLVEYSNVPVAVPGTGVNSLIVLAQPLASFTTVADANGIFSADVTVGEAGTYTLKATGSQSGRVVTASVSVDPAFAGSGGGSNASAPEDSSGLPDTGSDFAMLLWGAAGVLALGVGLASAAFARRRNA